MRIIAKASLYVDYAPLRNGEARGPGFVGVEKSRAQRQSIMYGTAGPIAALILYDEILKPSIVSIWGLIMS